MENKINNNIFNFESPVTMAKREQLNKNKSLCIWMTGLSGSGKSTLAGILEQKLFEKGIRTYLLDGDNLRSGLNSDLSFGKSDRNENIRRAGEIAKLFVDAGIVVIASFISPFRKDRDEIRKKLSDKKFIEVYVNCDLYTCEERDPKKLYMKARNNEIADFTGISAPYEPPDDPELTINNGAGTDPERNSDLIFKYILKRIL